MSQMNLGQLVNLDQVQPSVQIAQSPVEYTQGGVSGGQVQVGDPGVILASYAPPDSQAAMFFALSDIARGVQQGLNNFDQIATSIDKSKIQDAEAQFGTISEDETLSPEQKEDKMNEYLKSINTPYLGNRWRQQLNNNMSRYWTSTEAQTKYYGSKLDEFILNVSKKDPNFVGTEEQMAVVYTQFFNEYPNATNIPAVVNLQTRNNRILTQRTIDQQKEAFKGAFKNFVVSQTPAESTFSGFIQGTLPPEEMENFRYQYAFLMPIIDRFISDPNVRTEDLYAMLQGQADSSFWIPYFKENPNLNMDAMKDYKEDTSDIVLSLVSQLSPYMAIANRHRIRTTSENRLGIVGETGTASEYEESLRINLGNIEPSTSKFMITVSTVPQTIKSKLDQENPLVESDKRWHDLSLDEKVDYLKKRVSTLKTTIEKEGKTHRNFTDISNGWFRSIDELRLDSKVGFGLEQKAVIKQAEADLKSIEGQIAGSYGQASISSDQAQAIAISRLVQLEKNLTGHVVTVDDQGNLPDSMLFGMVYSVDQNGIYTFDPNKTLETWIEETKAKPEVYKRLERSGLLHPDSKDTLVQIQSALRSAYDAIITPPQAKDPSTTQAKTYKEDSLRRIEAITSGTSLSEMIETSQRVALTLERGDTPAFSDIAIADTWLALQSEAEAELVKYRGQNIPQKPTPNFNMFIDETTNRPITSFPTAQDWTEARIKNWIDDSGELTQQGVHAYIRTVFASKVLGRVSGVSADVVNKQNQELEKGLRGLLGSNFFTVVKTDPGQAYYAMAVLSGYAESDPSGTKLTTVFGTGSEAIDNTKLLLKQLRRSNILIPSLNQLNDVERQVGTAFNMFIQRVASAGSSWMYVPSDDSTKEKPKTRRESVQDAVSILQSADDPRSIPVWLNNEAWVRIIAEKFRVNYTKEDLRDFYEDLNTRFNLGLPGWSDDVTVSIPTGPLNFKDGSENDKVLYAVKEFLKDRQNKVFFSHIFATPDEAFSGYVDRKFLLDLGPMDTPFSSEGMVIPTKYKEQTVKKDTVSGSVRIQSPKEVEDATRGITRKNLFEVVKKQIGTKATVGLGSLATTQEFSPFQPSIAVNNFRYTKYDNENQFTVEVPGSYVLQGPTSESEFIVDTVIQTPLDYKQDGAYDLYKLFVSSLNDEENLISEDDFKFYIIDFNVNRPGSDNSFSQHPSLWEFILLHHNIDITDPERKISISNQWDTNGSLYLAIQAKSKDIDGGLIERSINATDVSDILGRMVPQNNWKTTSEYEDYKTERQERFERLEKHRAYRRYQQDVKSNPNKRLTYVSSAIEATKRAAKNTEVDVFVPDIEKVFQQQDENPGYLGSFRITRPNGTSYTVTEYPIGVEMREFGRVTIPLLVPTLTGNQINDILQAIQADKDITTIKDWDLIYRKALNHAEKRIRSGLDPLTGGNIVKVPNAVFNEQGIRVEKHPDEEWDSRRFPEKAPWMKFRGDE